ncbi:DNA-binding protein [Pueribacillus theae]|uniref:DNA-binding protein n=1 Tax=Pueribacillus theae TaxID=2171751 RepID=A0A2U1K3S5_9BACI|nr:DNA-binding protein [Pueribacillus theae]PWA12187.1 DNA-binding protein [Pueribacillus theae]
MELDFLWIGIGMAIAGYFIGDGLKNFKNPNAKNLIDSFDEDEELELIKENEVHYFLGIAKEDVQSLIQEYPNIPHITINGKIYFQKSQLREWLLNLGK